MSSTYKYFKLTIKHKWFVFLAGLKVGCPIWRLIKHDWTKFLPSELSYYGNQFFGKADNPQGFIKCWLHHQNMNDHHWEYYIPRTGHNRCNPPYPDNEPIDMTDGAIKEMISDWFGASRAYEGKWPTKGDWKWFDNNFDRIRVTSTTKIIIQNILDVYFKITTKKRK